MVSVIERWLYLKMVWGRGLAHTNTLRSIAEFGFLIAVFFKLYSIPGFLAVIAAVLSVVATFALGFTDIRKGWYSLDTSINNKHNPELMRAARKRS